MSKRLDPLWKKIYSSCSDKKHKDKLPGGLADDKKPSEFNEKELHKGMKHEKEHTKDKGIAREIAMDHLTEDPKYYSKGKGKGKAD